jgi:hypothetical protein
MRTTTLILGVAMFTLGIAFIVGTLLGRAGVTSIISRPNADRRPASVRANILLGSGMALMAVSWAIPQGYEQTVLLLAICLLVASVLQFPILSRNK